MAYNYFIIPLWPAHHTQVMSILLDYFRDHALAGVAVRLLLLWRHARPAKGVVRKGAHGAGMANAAQLRQSAPPQICHQSA